MANPTRGTRFGTILAAALCLHAGGAAAIDYKIVTANTTGTYFAIGTDLAKFVAPDADIALEVLPSAGSAANIKHLRYDLGVKFAIVQADVFQPRSASSDCAADPASGSAERLHGKRPGLHRFLIWHDGRAGLAQQVVQRFKSRSEGRS